MLRIRRKELHFKQVFLLDSADNQLALWILFARQVNPNIQACIKGDTKTEFPLVKKVLDIMQDKNVNKFNLITSLEAAKINLQKYRSDMAEIIQEEKGGGKKKAKKHAPHIDMTPMVDLMCLLIVFLYAYNCFQQGKSYGD